MERLEIKASIDYYMGMPSEKDQAVRCQFEIAHFVENQAPAQKELDLLNAFRRSVTTLLVEAVEKCRLHPDQVEPPTIRLKLEGGEECRKPSWTLTVFLQRLEVKGEPWSLDCSRGEEEFGEIICAEVEPLLEIIEDNLQRELSAWFSEVRFERTSVEPASLPAARSPSSTETNGPYKRRHGRRRS